MLSLLPGLFFLLAPAISANPIRQRDSSAPFNLATKVLSNDLTPSLDGTYLATYHISPCEDYAVLSASEYPAFVINGTSTQLTEDAGTLITTGSSPSGLNITSVAGEGLTIDCGPGSPGLYLQDDVLTVNSALAVSFYACNNASLPFGAAVQLHTKVYTETTPAGCADIQLVAEYTG